jgi:hypothetical protein
MHKSISEYASTTDISATAPLSYSWCSHFHPIQRKIEVCFLLEYFQNPKIKRLSWKKQREKKIKGIEREREREELSKALMIKG